MARFFRGQGGEHAFAPEYRPALVKLLRYSVIFFVAVMGIYYFATLAGLPEWAVAVLELAVALALVGFIFARLGGEVAPVFLGALLFVTSLFFNALQPMSHALTADLVPSAAYLGAAFGLWNLIGEMGAVLAPAISGVMRETTGGWGAAVLLDGATILVSFVLLMLVREPRTEAVAGAGRRP